MATITDVPVIDINSDNFVDMWPTILLSIKTSSFIAFDLELSGLGDRRKLMAHCVDDRYHNIVQVAETRSVLSLGVSCFTVINEAVSHSKALSVHVQTFNLTLLCNDDYVVEPKSLQFLIDHGFDFNKQYAKGLRYHKGKDIADETGAISTRGLVSQIISAAKPIVLHNGLIDLVFLYQNFYASLPSKLSTFLADTSEMFKAGVFDTKYIAEFLSRMPASYLEYVFRRCHRQNELDLHSGARYVTTTFPRYPASQRCVSYQSCRLQSDSSGDTCQQFANHGYCNNGSKCLKSHNISNILDRDFAVKQKKRNRNRKRKHCGSENGADKDTEAPTPSGGGEQKAATPPVDTEGNNGLPPGIGYSEESNNDQADASSENTDSDTIKSTSTNYGNHRAGFDAFMTGFSMATFYLIHGDVTQNEFSFGVAKNKLYLSGKDMPLLITKSNFARTSAEHSLKLAKISLSY